MDNTQAVSLKTSFFGKQIAPWRMFFFVGSSIFYFPVCVISALTDREYRTFITHMLHIIGQNSTVVAVMTLMTIYVLLIFSMHSNGACYAIAAIQFLDCWSPILLESMAPIYFSSWNLTRDAIDMMGYLNYHEHLYEFFKFIIPDVLLNYFPRARIGLAYDVIFTSGIFLVPACMLILAATTAILTTVIAILELQKKFMVVLCKLRKKLQAKEIDD